MALGVRSALATVSALARGGGAAAGAGGRGPGLDGHARSYLERGRWAVQGVDRRPSIRMFSRRLALASCSGGRATVKMPMRLAAMSSAVTSARSSPVTRPALRISSMAASSSVWVWAWAISPDSIIASSVSSMPFLVAIQSPNSSIQRRSAAGGASWASSSRAPSVTLAPAGVTAAIDLYGTEAAQAARELSVPDERITTIAAQADGITPANGANAAPGTIDEIARLVAAGQLRVPIAASFPVEQIRVAVELQASRHVHGKVVIDL